MRFDAGYMGGHPAADYFTSVDRDQAPPPEIPESEAKMFTEANKPDVGLGIQDIGMSVPMGISASNVAGVYSKIRMGAGQLEIQFPGYRQGNRNSQTPGLLGEDQRQAFREMQMANDVRLNTHASFGLMGMMGRDERGNFSTYGGYMDMMELKRAIDFQADISGGGSVVMHSGEFDRPMTDMYLDDETHQLNLARDKEGRLLVKQAHTQEFDAQFKLLDNRTSAIMETVQKDRLVAYPHWNKATRDYEGVDVEGNRAVIHKDDYIDYRGRKILDPYDALKGRVPEFNPETGRFKVDMKHFDYFKKEAEEFNAYLEKDKGRELTYMEKIYPEEMFLRATLETQEGNSRGWALYYGQDSERAVKQLEGLEKAKKFYEELDRNIPEEDKWKLLQQDDELGRYTKGMIPNQSRMPLDIIKEQIREAEKRLEFARQSSGSQEQQAKDTFETKNAMITPIKRLEQHGVRMYAEAGLHAMQRSKDPDNPVVVAIENLFPERFGGHIEELKWVIKKSRERMVEMLTSPTIPQGFSRKPVEMDEEKLNEAFSATDSDMWQENPYYTGMNKEEAEQIAAKHIKATLDTGHLNMWRKFWQNDPKLTQSQNDERFKQWYLEQIESLAKDGMIGNVHLADNYGFHDEHLSPGQGNAPIKEAMKIIKDNGYDKAITVEPGADATTDLSDFHGLMKTWQHFGSNIYGMGTGGVGGAGGQAPGRWTDVQNSYFGQNQSPYFVFGGYAPSNDWTLWSSVPME